jgi:Domain of unknown function (DUF4837)
MVIISSSSTQINLNGYPAQLHNHPCDLSLAPNILSLMKYLSISLVFILLSCTSKNSLAPAIGISGKINIIMTPEQWDGAIGTSLDSLFTQEMTVLPRPETIFKIRHVDPENVNSSMKRTRNLIFAFTLDDESEKSAIIKRMLTTETINQLKKDTSVFMKTISNVYATNQEVMYLFGPDEKTLAAKIKKNGQKLIDHFNYKERVRITKGLLNASATKNMTAMLEKERGYTIKIPYGYRLADNKDDFVWLRQINQLDDKDIFIARKKYTSEKDFKKENLIQYRNDICRKYLYEDPKKSDSYLLTETGAPDKEVLTREINFDGRYAVEMKGLWRSNRLTMGGPFMGIAFVDEKKGDFYYIEAFTYCPSKDQREIMRELETVLFSFKLK